MSRFQPSRFFQRHFPGFRQGHVQLRLVAAEAESAKAKEHAAVGWLVVRENQYPGRNTAALPELDRGEGDVAADRRGEKRPVLGCPGEVGPTM
jgi:hypothetical protein